MKNIRQRWLWCIQRVKAVYLSLHQARKFGRNGFFSFSLLALLVFFLTCGFCDSVRFFFTTEPILLRSKCLLSFFFLANKRKTRPKFLFRVFSFSRWSYEAIKNKRNDTKIGSCSFISTFLGKWFVGGLDDAVRLYRLISSSSSSSCVKTHKSGRTHQPPAAVTRCVFRRVGWLFLLGPSLVFIY